MKTTLKQFLLSTLLIVVVFYASSVINHLVHHKQSAEKCNCPHGPSKNSTAELVDIDYTDLYDDVDRAPEDNSKFIYLSNTTIDFDIFTQHYFQSPISLFPEFLINTPPIYVLICSFRI